jgi:hypothetical protein
MPPFRRVEDCRASPSALGILVPPGLRTVVILRPRALDWDLLPARVGEGAAIFFSDFDRDEAAGVARQVLRALEREACGETNPVAAMANPAGTGYVVVARPGEYGLIACPRIPGQPYRPMVFATIEEASAAAERLAAVLWPAAEANQEYYFNTQNFTRTPSPLGER